MSLLKPGNTQTVTSLNPTYLPSHLPDPNCNFRLIVAFAVRTSPVASFTRKLPLGWLKQERFWANDSLTKECDAPESSKHLATAKELFEIDEEETAAGQIRQLVPSGLKVQQASASTTQAASETLGKTLTLLVE